MDKKLKINYFYTNQQLKLGEGREEPKDTVAQSTAPPA